MELVLGDNFEFVNGHTGRNRSPQNPSWSKRSERCGLQLNSVTNFSSVRDSLMIKIFTYVQNHRAPNYFSRGEIILFFRTLLGSVHVLLN